MGSRLRVVFMGTPEFSVPTLERLAARHQVVGVFSQPDRPVGRGLTLTPTPVKKKAIELGIPVFQPEKASAEAAFTQLRLLMPDVIVVVAFGQLLKKNILELPRLGCLNIHSSLLPRWRGAAPIQRAILAGDSETGVTTMLMAEKLDAGPILLQRKTPIVPDDTAQTLHDRLAGIGADLILETLDALANGRLEPRVQDESLVTHAAKLGKELEWLDWSQPAAALDHAVRALNPWPGTSVKVAFDGKPGADPSFERLRIRRARPRADIAGKPGELFERHGMVLLGTAQGSLECIELQWEGKKPVDSAGFLNGLKGKGRALPLRLQP